MGIFKMHLNCIWIYTSTFSFRKLDVLGTMRTDKWNLPARRTEKAGVEGATMQNRLQVIEILNG